MDGQVHNKCNSIKRNKHTNTYREEELKEPGQEKGGKKAAAKRQTMKINYFLRQSETRKMCENGWAEATAAAAAESVVKCRRLMCAEIVQEFPALIL